jgi:signal peptidase II
LRVLIISCIIVFIDQISKLLVKGINIPFLNLEIQGLTYGEQIPLIDGFFNLTLVENPGIGFGMDLGSDYKLLLTLITLVIGIGMLLYLYIIREKPLRLRLSIACIIGGAFGNLIDRMFYGVFFDYAPLMYGKVVDFFNINFFSIYIFNKTIGNYVFNIADVAITAGVLLLVFSYNNLSEEEKSTTNTNVVV